MPLVKLRAPLRERADGRADHDLPGGTVGEVLRELEERHPKVKGWILDDQSRVRPHVNVFVNGERKSEDTPVGSNDELLVLPSISGGSWTRRWVL